jgi:hypothetical protein
MGQSQILKTAKTTGEHGQTRFFRKIGNVIAAWPTLSRDPKRFELFAPPFPLPCNVHLLLTAVRYCIRMHPRRAFLVALSFLSLTRGTDAQSTASELDAGPLFQEFKLTLQPGRRTEAVGPFYYSEQIDSERGWAIPPLLSYREDSETDFAELDFAYPFLTWDRFGEEYRFQIFQVFSFAGGRTQDDDLKRRFTLFPFYFQQRAPDPEDNYTALIPFYGRLKNRFFRDEVRFVLMPLYVQSRKRDVVTDNYVYPFFHLRRGNELSGWQFWPLIGKEHKNLTYRTNSFGETEPIAGHDKFFLLWPFHFNNRLGLGTTNLESQKVLLPFYSRHPGVHQLPLAIWLHLHRRSRKEIPRMGNALAIDRFQPRRR